MPSSYSRSPDPAANRAVPAGEAEPAFVALDETGDSSEQDHRARELAARYGYPLADLADYREDVSLWRRIPMELLLRYRFVPLAEQEGRLRIAVSEPSRYRDWDELELTIGLPLGIEVAPAYQLERILSRNTDSSFLLDKASEDLRFEISADPSDGQTIDTASDGESSPIVRLVNSLLVNAVERRASDIHVETKESEVLLKYRIDGVLYQAMEPIGRIHHQTIVSRLKVMAELDVAEKRVPQDGRFKARIGDRNIDFRVSVMPSVYGEDVVVRVLDKQAIGTQFSELRLDLLGFDGGDLARVRRAVREPYGMMLVTGPTGSGKTTTLYAALSEIATPEDKIVTIEDPVEYQIELITQVPVNEKKGLTFARGLRSILRHDPDTIMVGEVRDAETATIAVQAALTGHLVFTTVHANNAFDVIGRFLHMDVEPYNLVTALNAVLAQRLVRLICTSCRTQVVPSELDLELSAISDSAAVFFEGAGCRECEGSGFRGRTAIGELLNLTDELRQMILQRRSVSELKARAQELGMTSLRDNALREAYAGRTTLREINKVTFVE